MTRPGRIALALCIAASLVLPAGGASHGAPKPDITKMDYAPIGAFKAGDPIPSPLEPPSNPNPSGKWVSYDTNVYETLNFPSRQPGDTSASDPPGSGDARHGFCPPHPQFMPWGKCANHQLEFLDHFERAMKEILGDFGVVVHRYPFVSPGSGTRGTMFAAPGGSGWNISATVPGADHPEESVLISGHYDYTDSGPATAWDSAEGHAIVIRVAKILADYWRSTGTRPSATVKFIPWDSEESGLWGSADYVENNIPPGEEAKVRGYFNMDPCGGAYPAYYRGEPGNRIKEVLQLANPAIITNPAVRQRVERFNARAETIIDEVFDHLDDTIEIAPGVTEPIFVSDSEAAALGVPSQRGEVVTAIGGIALGSSDYANFEAVGIPIFNLFPDAVGPHDDGTPASPEGILTFHTPRDNLQTVNAFTSRDQTGLGVSEGWAKGMEMCAHIEGWYLLQPEMGGARAVSADPVAYFEALPNEAIVQEQVRFDASGSYQYAAERRMVDEGDLRYAWSFGDGTAASGKVVAHRYAGVGRYSSRLTVTNISTGASDTMTIPIEVIPSTLIPPVLDALPASDEDGTFALSWTFAGDRTDLAGYDVQESRDLKRALRDDVEGDIGERWTASPGDGTLQPWQRSDGSQPKGLGNKRHSGSASYWTGVFPTVLPAGTNKESVLTLKQPLRIPGSGEPLLSYWSLFASEVDDEGRVEIAEEDGNPATPERWQPVDVTGGGLQIPAMIQGDRTFSLRTVDLRRFRGKTILLRFRYVLGPAEGTTNQPAGWYVDDVRVESGSWTRIGRPEAMRFEVAGRPRGSFSYRVLGRYRDGILTQPSETATINVTKGTTPKTNVRGARKTRTLPETGAGPPLAAAFAALAAANALARMLRRGSGRSTRC